MLKKFARTMAYIGGIVTGFYLFASAPGIHKKTKWQHLTGWDYAHRGLYDNEHGIPENSIAAFRRAVDKGYGIELDVHLTADNQLVVFHDDTLTRMCGMNKKISSFLYSDLMQLRLLGTEEGIPLFKDVLELIDGKVPLIIELKVDGSNQNLLCPLVWQLLSRYKGDYCIESFHPFVLQWFKRHEPQVVRGQLSCNFFKENPHCDIVLFLMSNLMTNFFTHPDFIAYKYLDLDNPAVIYNRKLFHIMTVVWTIPGKPTYDRFKNKVDAMIFEGFEP
ncbi:glycerophosphodiester phosphodiesterase [Coprococcus catus]|uniref:Glycerophosphodiester phosphodiesterase n=1 Tax=Coprococcus catus TaxID=116085 RepID=A0A3E2XLD2_9FIRM|nr:glycerophosphodiester phosphodiesterase [Coprococcus catus]RGC46993.1 glycerophosphodiester phosphodiesterase [Coprococcus catus]